MRWNLNIINNKGDQGNQAYRRPRISRISRIILSIIFILHIQAFAAETISFNDATVFDAVQLLGRRAGVNVIFSGDKTASTAKRVTLQVQDGDPVAVMEQILASNGFNFEREGNLYIVSALPQDINNSGYTNTEEVMGLKYVSPQKMAELINKMELGAAALCDGPSNQLVIKGKKGNLLRAKEIINKLDVPTPKIFLQAEMIEVAQSGLEKIGITFGNEQSGFVFTVAKDGGSIKKKEDLNIIVGLMIASGEAELLARPSLTVLNGEEAQINIGSKIPFAVPATNSGATTLWSVDYIDSGISLKILPYVSKEKIITATIKPEVSSISEWRTTAAGDFPVISTRNASTTLTVKDGETIAIAGLISNQTSKNQSKVPFFGDIPLLGWFFRYEGSQKAKSEVVFLMTPRVIE
jgi:type II secretory pathway component GspD/PulD (secretin)